MKCDSHAKEVSIGSLYITAISFRTNILENSLSGYKERNIDENFLEEDTCRLQSKKSETVVIQRPL